MTQVRWAVTTSKGEGSDMIVPYPHGASSALVTELTVAVEAAYLTYAVHGFSQLFRVSAVLALGYLLLVGLLGIEHVAHLVLPPMHAQS